ncbi:ABC transporter permease subunit [Bdellovibrionota bacterium FG-2]
MWNFLGKRLLLMLPTLWGISLLGFFLINWAPGSPVEMALRHGLHELVSDSAVSHGVRFAVEKQYGLDRPLVARYGIWLRSFLTLDFGQSFSYQRPVLAVIAEKLPVSMQLGGLSFILAYLFAIPLGILMAIKRDRLFDTGASLVLWGIYCLPPLMMALLMLVFLAGGSFVNLFPLGGLISDYYSTLSSTQKLLDRLWHLVLPLSCYTAGSFVTLTFVVRGSVLDEIKKDYIATARAKGLSEKRVVLAHAFRNALIPVVTGLGSYLSAFFAGSILVETIFGLEGVGLMSYNAVLARDYPLIMGSLMIQSVLFLLGNLLSDLLYGLVDPRVDFL